jgi:hypothetical protein
MVKPGCTKLSSELCTKLFHVFTSVNVPYELWEQCQKLSTLASDSIADRLPNTCTHVHA